METNSNHMNTNSIDSDLYQILRPLLACHDYIPFDFNPESAVIIEKTLFMLNSFYNTNYRNSYYIAFQLISGTLQNEEGNADSIAAILKDLQKYTEQNQDEFQNKDKIFKLIDYLYLELARYNTFNDNLNTALEKAVELESQYDNFYNETNNLREDINDAKSKTDDIIGKSVSILGVFTGIVMAFSGAFSILSGAFDSLSSNISKYRVFGLFSLIGFIIYNVTVVLLFVIARISGKDIGVRCKQQFDCGGDCIYCSAFDCEKSTIKKTICQSVNKYPHIIIGELLLLYIMYFIFCTWFFNSKNRDIFPSFLELINKNPIIHDVVLLLFLIAPFVLLFFIYRYIFPQKNQVNNCKDFSEDSVDDI
jgi:hypothetical protein